MSFLDADIRVVVLSPKLQPHVIGGAHHNILLRFLHVLKSCNNGIQCQESVNLQQNMKDIKCTRTKLLVPMTESQKRRCSDNRGTITEGIATKTTMMHNLAIANEQYGPKQTKNDISLWNVTAKHLTKSLQCVAIDIKDKDIPVSQRKQLSREIQSIWKTIMNTLFWPYMSDIVYILRLQFPSLSNDYMSHDDISTRDAFLRLLLTFIAMQIERYQLNTLTSNSDLTQISELELKNRFSVDRNNSHKLSVCQCQCSFILCAVCHSLGIACYEKLNSSRDINASCNNYLLIRYADESITPTITINNITSSTANNDESLSSKSSLTKKYETKSTNSSTVRSQANQLIVIRNQNQWHEIAAATEPRVIAYTMKTCGHCIRLHPNLLEAATKSKYKIYNIEISDDPSAAWVDDVMKSMQVQSFPTVVRYNGRIKDNVHFGGGIDFKDERTTKNLISFAS